MNFLEKIGFNLFKLKEYGFEKHELDRITYIKELKCKRENNDDLLDRNLDKIKILVYVENDKNVFEIIQYSKEGRKIARRIYKKDIGDIDTLLIDINYHLKNYISHFNKIKKVDE